MSKEWDRLYNILSNRGTKEPEFVELNKIHKPDWWDEFHQYDVDGNVKDSGLRVKLFTMREVDYSTIESLPAGSFFIVAAIKSNKVSYYINLRIATEGKWQTMLRHMSGPNIYGWQNSPITYFGRPSEIMNIQPYKYYLIEKNTQFINWQTDPFEVKS